MRKYKATCKKNYVEGDNIYLYEGKYYDIEEEDWNGTVMRKVMLPLEGYVGFLSIPFYNYFYTESEMRDMKLQEIGIETYN